MLVLDMDENKLVYINRGCSKDRKGIDIDLHYGMWWAMSYTGYKLSETKFRLVPKMHGNFVVDRKYREEHIINTDKVNYRTELRRSVV